MIKREDKRVTEDPEPPRKRPRSGSPKDEVTGVKSNAAPSSRMLQPHSNGTSIDPSRDEPARRERSKSAIQSTTSRVTSATLNGTNKSTNMSTIKSANASINASTINSTNASTITNKSSNTGTNTSTSTITSGHGRSASEVSGGMEQLEHIDLSAPLSELDTSRDIENIEQFIKYNSAWDSKYDMYIKLYKQLDKNKKQIELLKEDYSTASGDQRQRTAEQVKHLYIERNQVRNTEQ